MATVIKAVKKFVRNNVETPWYTSSQAAEDYIEKTYVETGHRLTREKSISDDGLTLSITSTWTDRDIYNKFYNDPTLVEVMYKPRQAYNNANGIKGLDVVISSETQE